NRDGSFQKPRSFEVGVNPDFLVVGDFNGDGKLDLATINEATDKVSVYLGKGDGSFQTERNLSVKGGTFGGWPFPITDRVLVAADFNGDGKLDLAGFDIGNEMVVVLLGAGDGTFGSPIPISVGQFGDIAGLGLGDFNGDGKLDILGFGALHLTDPTTALVFLG